MPGHWPRRTSGVIAALGLFFVPPPGPAAGDRDAFVLGPARVLASDRIEVADTPVILYGIRTPEAQKLCRSPQGRIQRCGEWTREVLQTFLDGVHGDMFCLIMEPAEGKAVVGRCVTGAGTDASRYMVRKGAARADLSRGADYVAAEARARSDGKGLWHARAKGPPDWEALKP